MVESNYKKKQFTVSYKIQEIMENRGHQHTECTQHRKEIKEVMWTVFPQKHPHINTKR